jgi:hypothetical protein
MVLHLELKQKIEASYGNRVPEGVTLSQDALLVSLDNGVTVEMRYLNPAEYSIGWVWGDVELRIDTAPLHRGLGTFPNHFHDADGRICADLVTRPGRPPWENVSRLLEALLENPLLIHGEGEPNENVA